MADGSLQTCLEAQAEARLDERRPGARLIARCRCGCEAEIDPRPWLAQGLAGAPLFHLETRLRCLCGARRAMLELHEGPPRPGRGIWVFR